LLAQLTVIKLLKPHFVLMLEKHPIRANNHQTFSTPTQRLGKIVDKLGLVQFMLFINREPLHGLLGVNCPKSGYIV
jgi:hypothetical protein